MNLFSKQNFLLPANANFKFLCRYMKCYNRNKENNCSLIKSKATMKTGFYAFVNDKGRPLYIGVAYDRPLYDRIVQHFRDNDTGGLRSKLKKLGNNKVKELEKSKLYVCCCTYKKQNLRFMEAYLIGANRTKFNFL